MIDLSTRVGTLPFKNPILAASGTAGFGRELGQWMDLGRLGGICSKGITLQPRLGNPSPRVAETASGMLNSVGLQNPGLDAFLRDELDAFTQLGCRAIVNVAGHDLDDYVIMSERLNDTKIDCLELNLSCPNVRTGCISIGSDPSLIRELVKAVKSVTCKPLWVKLTPNVTRIVDMAWAAAEAGADAVVLINTLLGLAIDRKSRRPILRNNTGGLSGPAIKPVALRMISEVYRQVNVPIVGVGGIQTAEDVLEFMLAGASAVEIGTATLRHPRACLDILDQLPGVLEADGECRISSYTGALRMWS